MFETKLVQLSLIDTLAGPKLNSLSHTHLILQDSSQDTLSRHFEASRQEKDVKVSCCEISYPDFDG
jgi:hypothetical protein